MSKNREYVIGIDLGTTYSAVAYVDRHGAPITVTNAEGELTTASVVMFDEENAVSVGRRAQRMCRTHPDRTVECVKREMGEETCSKPIGGKYKNPIHISALILKKLRQDAEQKLGPIAGAVITVPAYFDDGRRQATAEAGAIAGLNVMDILNEPTAAALAYGFNDYLESQSDDVVTDTILLHSPKPGIVAVYDLGGGTFDVSIVRIENEEFRVLASEGDVRLGGKDWDDRIVKYAADLFKSKFDTDPTDDPYSHQELLFAAEEAKRDLSQATATEFTVSHNGNRLIVDLGRDTFDEMTSDLLFRTESRLHRAVENAGLDIADIQRFLLVGGSTRMPQVRSMITKATGIEPDGSLSADEVVAHGAAIRAAMLGAKGKTNVATATPDKQRATATKQESAQVADQDAVTKGDDALVYPPGNRKNSPGGERLLDISKDDYEVISFNFDESVRKALTGAIVVNVSSRSLGVVAHSRKSRKPKNAILIPKGSELPASRRKTFGTVRENQDRVEVMVIEGESGNPRACTPIGKCVISRLPPNLPMGSEINVEFSYDESGMLHVQARDEKSGTVARTRITRKGAMTVAQLDKTKATVHTTTVN